MNRCLCAPIVLLLSAPCFAVPTEISPIDYAGSVSTTRQTGTLPPSSFQDAFGRSEAGASGGSSLSSSSGLVLGYASRVEYFASLTTPGAGTDRIAFSLSSRAGLLAVSSGTRASLLDTASYGEARFRVATPVAYQLTAMLATDVTVLTGQGAGWASGRLRFDSFTASIADVQAATFGVTPGTIDRVGVLQPGVYTLTASTFTRASVPSEADAWDGNAVLNASIVFTPVPSPGTGAVLAAGLTLAARRRRGLSPRAS